MLRTKQRTQLLGPTTQPVGRAHEVRLASQDDSAGVGVLFRHDSFSTEEDGVCLEAAGMSRDSA